MASEPPDVRKTSMTRSIGKMPKDSSHTSHKSLSRLHIRKGSYGYGSVPGIKPIERTSQLGIEFKRPPLIYFPTYQVESFHKFHHAKTQKIIDSVLDEHFTGFKYNPQESPTTALRMAGQIMRQVKALNFNRYRIIAVVTIGQKRSQSYNNAVAFLWDGQRDCYVEVHREVTTAIIQVTVFGVYLD